MKILVTGGTGFIGSHCTLELLTKGHEVLVVDNLSNSDDKVLDRINSICGSVPRFLAGDICDLKFIESLFQCHRITAIFHFGGKKSVNESLLDPMSYYDTNITGTLNLLRSAIKHNVNKFIFSSSATVYNETAVSPVAESAPVSGSTPYGRSKLFVEKILKDLCASRPEFSAAALRYFNPAGAHPSGLLGENPTNKATNLIPIVTDAAIGHRESVSIFGDDYDTEDGSGVRDYIHVMDLVAGHVAALDALQNRKGFNVWNLGTGRGESVHAVIDVFERVSRRKIKRQIMPRRPGDRAYSFADSSKAEAELNRTARKSL